MSISTHFILNNLKQLNPVSSELISKCSIRSLLKTSTFDWLQLATAIICRLEPWKNFSHDSRARNSTDWFKTVFVLAYNLTLTFLCYNKRNLRQISESSRLHFCNIVEVDLGKLRRNSTHSVYLESCCLHKKQVLEFNYFLKCFFWKLGAISYLICWPSKTTELITKFNFFLHLSHFKWDRVISFLFSIW